MRCSNWVFKLGWSKLGCSSLARCEGRDVVDILVSILLGSKPLHHVKVNPLGEEEPQHP
jgi:hypothetical protein